MPSYVPGTKQAQIGLKKRGAVAGPCKSCRLGLTASQLDVQALGGLGATPKHMPVTTKVPQSRDYQFEDRQSPRASE